MVYGSTKGAINGMMMPMARDLGRFGIRVAAVAPGIYDTPIFDYVSKPYKVALCKLTPLGRFGHPEEFAHFVGTMIENSYVNGVTLKVDGGIKLSHM